MNGVGVAVNFISRRTQPCKERMHPAYEYVGDVDTTREARGDENRGHCPSGQGLHCFDFVEKQGTATVIPLGQPASSCEYLLCPLLVVYPNVV